MFGDKQKEDYWVYAYRSTKALFLVAAVILALMVWNMFQVQEFELATMLIVGNVAIMTLFWLALWRLFKNRSELAITVSYTGLTILLILNLLNLLVNPVGASVGIFVFLVLLYVTYKAQQQGTSSQEN